MKMTMRINELKFVYIYAFILFLCDSSVVKRVHCILHWEFYDYTDEKSLKYQPVKVKDS